MFEGTPQCGHGIANCAHKLEPEELGFSKMTFGKSFSLWAGSEVWQAWVWILALVLPSSVTPSKLPNISMSQWPHMWNTDNKHPYLTGLLVCEGSGSKGLTLKTLKVASSSTFCEWNCKSKRYKVTDHLSISLQQVCCWQWALTKCWEHGCSLFHHSLQYFHWSRAILAGM